MRQIFARSLRMLQVAAISLLASSAPGAQPASYVRVIDADDGTIQLQVAVRTLTPPVAEGAPGPGGPVVYLAGAVHIADAPFYDALQEFLDAQDLVLFEGVKPPGAGRDLAAASDEERITQTQRRLRFLATASAQYRAEHGAAPATLDELAAGMDGRLAGLVSASRLDAWGRPIELAALPEAKSKRSSGVDLVSLGADGLPGGDGPDADLRFSDQKGLSAQERGQGDAGIQEQLAEALGLEFQKDGVDWTKANWRNSDMSMDEIMDRLDANNGGGDAIFSVLQGGSFMGKVAGLALKLIGMSPTSRTMAKLMIAEMLGQAEDLLTASPGVEGLMQVIIHDRNAVVVEDLRRVIADEPEVRTIAIFYGAGHLVDLEERICAELGYTPGTDQWHTAMTVDPAEAGLTPAQAAPMRAMIRKTIQDQVAAAKRASRPSKGKKKD
jgi:hypothetical protein